MKQIATIATTIALTFTVQLATAAPITDTYTAGDPLTATTMNNIKSAVNDNDMRVGGNTGDIATNAINIGINDSAITDHETRITDLESASPAVGRIALTSTVSGVVSDPLPDALTTTATSTMFTTPSDYVTGTITLKALISGCSGSNVQVSISSGGVNVGSNSLFFIFPTSQTVFIPTSAFLSFEVVEVATTVSGFSDLNNISLARFGADALDTCATDLTVQGFIVEYPRG